MYLVFGRLPKQHVLFCRFNNLSNSERSHFSSFSFKDEAEFKQCYRILEVNEGSSQEEVKAAFLRLAKQYHPDVNSEVANAAHFHKVETAYRKLQDKFQIERKLDEQHDTVGHFKDKSKDQPEKGSQSADDEQSNDDYVAPQHRQYLNYGGIGHGTPFDREKQHRKYQVKKAVEHVYNHRVSKIPNTDEHSLIFKEAKAVKKIKTQYGIDRMVEDLIQESMAKGEFSNLKGSGKPLQYQNHNPFVDIVTQKINQVLIDNGFSPQWVMLEKEIRLELSSLKEKLKGERAKLGQAPLNSSDAKQWQSVLKALEDDVKIINKKINDYNLIVPLLNKQMVHVNLNRLAEKCLIEQPSSEEVGSSSNFVSPGQTHSADTQPSFLGYLVGLWR